MTNLKNMALIRRRFFLLVLPLVLLVACQPNKSNKTYTFSDGRQGTLEEYKLPAYLPEKTVIIVVDVSLISPGDVKYVLEAVSKKTGSSAYYLPKGNSVAALVYESKDRYYLPEGLQVSFFYVKNNRLYGVTGEGLEIGRTRDPELLTLLNAGKF